MENDKRRLFVGLVRKALGLPNGSSSCCAKTEKDPACGEHDLQAERSDGCHEAHTNEWDGTTRAAAN